MCNLYSIATNQAAIIALLRVINRYTSGATGGKCPPRAIRALAGSGVIQPFLRLYVCPTRDSEARGGGHAFAGTNDHMLTRA
jgi:hypothetical protein